ncbi:MAG TPA: hypothetical protein VFF49_02715 [Thermodesulfobacteriota bacterium]|nr:hypothetical protein [Thermodesulfobacteriota bacterium]
MGIATIITIVMRRVKEKGRTFIFLALSLFLIEETVRLGLSSVLFKEGEIDSMEKSLVLSPHDAELNFSLARLNHILTVDEKKAEAFYIRSLQLNPLLSSSWLGLTEMFVENAGLRVGRFGDSQIAGSGGAFGRSQNGEKQKALTTLRRLSELTPKSIAYLWEGSMLALRLGDKSMAMKSLGIVAKVDPGRRKRVFDICWEIIGDPELILDNVISDEVLPSYLSYLISKDKLDETFPVWKRMKRERIVSDVREPFDSAQDRPQSNDDIAFSYIEFLIRKNRGSDAFSIWSEVIGKSENNSLIWNGGFEHELLGRGFDWKTQKADGVSIDFDWEKRFQGTKSLRVEFDGKHNIDFYHISQVITLEPDTDYLLTSYMATREITTRNGISWEVYCYPTGSMTKATEPLTETAGWKRVELSFHTPSDCKSILLRLRRYKSPKLDRYISGTAWIDDVKLSKVESNANAQSR